MATQGTAEAQAPGTALEQVRPDQRALAQVASDLGVLKINATGMMITDLRAEGLAERFNILFAATTIMQANRNFTPKLSIVDISSDLTKGEIYPLETDYNGKPKPNSPYALTKVGIRKLADAAGITTLRPHIQPCGPQDRDVVITATITWRGLDGLPKEESDFADWHYKEEYENVEASCPEAYSGKPLTPKQREDWIRKHWKRVCGFGWRVTESKAMLRACRNALVLPGKFWLADLQKPFLVPSVSFTPDPDDKETLHAMAGIGQRATEMLYGPGASALAAEVRGVLEADEDTEEHINGEVIEEETADLPPHDPETGEIIEGQAIEEPVEQAQPTEPTGAVVTGTFAVDGDKPTDDRQIPGGKYNARFLSEICKEDPAYARLYFIKENSEGQLTTLGVLTEEWLQYWEPKKDDFSDVTFGEDEK